MKRIDIINAILDRTNYAWEWLIEVSRIYGPDSVEAGKARWAWAEMCKLCKDIGLKWDP